MNKCFSIIIILLFFISVNCITAYNINLDDCYTLEKINLDIKECVNFFNEYTKQINTINNISHKSTIYPNTSNIINKNINNSSNDSSKGNMTLNKSNALINKSDSKLNNISSVINSSNIHHNTTNLVNLSTDKDKHNVGLFNGTLHNQNQYNKTFKLLGLNHSVNNDLIFNDKELNILKSNSNMCDDSSEDNFLINPVPESDNKNYNILLLILPVLLVLLGVTILYKNIKR